MKKCANVGCRGWCSLYPLLLRWTTDLKGLEVGPTRFAVLDIQGDWPAFLQVFGLRYWSHKVHPCPLCRVTQEEIGELRLNDITVDSMPYESYGTNEYNRDLSEFVQVA